MSPSRIIYLFFYIFVFESFIDVIYTKDYRKRNAARINVELSPLRRHHHLTKRDSGLQPTIRSMKIDSTIRSRFSETLVTSVMENPSTESRLATLDLELPITAFISNFTMIIDGKLHMTDIDSKANASRRFKEARERNQTAGMVESHPKHAQPSNAMEKFTLSVSVKPNSDITFQLTYLQLLERVNGMYEQIISMRPNQIVANFTTNVFIEEEQGIKEFSIFEPSTGTNALDYEIARVEDLNATAKHVLFAPTVAQQKQMDPTKGLNGDFVVSYDVYHSNNAGSVVVEKEKYFAHYFSPDEKYYNPLSKNIIFVIDISGSMSGQKMDQTRAAMQFILAQLRSEDTFMMLIFDDLLDYWPSNKIPVVASSKNIKDAQVYASKYLFADGGTNIADAVTSACKVLQGQNNPAGSNIIVFLTDGEPTIGVTDTDKIVAMVSDAAAGKVTIFSLGFGFNLDFALLKKLSYRTGGKVQRIYEGEKLSNQLQDFYKSISTPLIFDISVYYPDNIVDTVSVTQSAFKQYFEGDEKVMVGKLVDSPASSEWKVSVTGQVSKGKSVELNTQVTNKKDSQTMYKAGFVEKLYVYKRIKDLLKQELMTDDKSLRLQLNAQALELALKYKLVTPLTSMILTEEYPQSEDYPVLGSSAGSGSGSHKTAVNIGFVSGSSHIINIQATLIYLIALTHLLLTT